MAKIETKTNEAPKYDWDALVKQHGSSSAAIRFLASQGLSTGAISKIGKTKAGVQMRFQHVRNVLKTPLKGRASTTGAE
jgi:hypothetical protein